MKKSAFDPLTAKLQRGENLTAAEHNMLAARPRQSRKKRAPSRKKRQVWS
jgi:hypothetical protein